ncbi:band 7 protein AGAP004871-like isoform X2 [Danaus plexippus]|uniref:band 7 protein AGAP004871-like isoform X2 n=1 Tax=Danaus plexippus TaxID=13037 RepID=UPI002AAF5F1E|nr:band 7 protein AGAP004871-like isoform X2 [Danaus plexippus]
MEKGKLNIKASQETKTKQDSSKSHSQINMLPEDTNNNIRSVQHNITKEKDNFIEKLLVVISIIFAILLFPLSLLVIFLVVRQFEKAVILRNGKIHKNQPFGPGLVFYLPCVDAVHFIDLRTVCYEVPHQDALTKDSLTVSVDAVVFYKIVDPVLAVIGVTDYKVSTHFLAATTLRNALGTRKLAELLASRPDVSQQVFNLMKNITVAWGIKIVRVEIKDISLPLQLQKAMAAEAESTRLANAKIIVAKSEIEATKSLQLATDILMDNPMCMQLRYLQSLNMIAGEKTHTIVFPFSVDVINKITS